MSGFMNKLKTALIQTAKNQGRYSSDSNHLGATSIEVDPEELRDSLADIMEHKFLQMKNPTKNEMSPNLIRRLTTLKNKGGVGRGWTGHAS
ncbi:hypothetical protein AX774_g6857 [Zancudomyces culisetae]|uniref:Uncharacterized protein n=1 Tax=Zancudomyces culisetae TaxID=1213189 RepID=A0A1R1PFM1_ZANCU|nr:hypothetical protein AX774_g6857 [Zancudomyces culisetae]|eukprot:OMH79719.1 hypothetical protein AX774_g6857 [Zancudomyces culisetae]